MKSLWFKVGAAALLPLTIVFFWLHTNLNFSFLSYSFLLWCLFWIIFFAKSFANHKLNYPLLVFVTTYSVFLFFIPWGIDTTDESYNLLLAQNLWLHKYNWLLHNFFVSYLPMHFYLKAFPSINILWARAVNAFLFAFMALVVYLIFSDFTQNKSLLAIIVILLSFSRFINSNYRTCYDDEPFFWFILSLWLLNLWFKSKKSWIFFLSIFTISISTVMRFTYGIFIPIFLFFPLTEKNKLLTLKGLFIATIILFAYLVWLKNPLYLLDFHGTKFCLNNNTYTFKNLIKQYALQFIYLIILLIVYLIIGFISFKLPEKLRLIFNIAVFLFVSLSFFIYPFSKLDYLHIIAIIAAASLAALVKTYNQNNTLFINILLGAIAMFIAYLGSNAGMIKIVYHSWFIVAAVSGFIAVEKFYPQLRSLLISALLILAVYQINHKIHHQTYRDAPITQLNTTLNITPIRGIFTTQQKANAIKSVYNFLKNKPIQNKFIALNKTLIIPIVTQKKPLMVCWNFNFPAIAQNKNLKYIITTNRNFGNGQWQVTDLKYNYTKFGFKKIFDNNIFQVYLRENR